MSDSTNEEGGSKGDDSPSPDLKVSRDTSDFVKPKNPPKFFGVDFDDTFYSLHDKDAFKKNVEAFAEVKRRGFVPFFCTGRSRDATFRLLGDDFETKTGYKGYPGVYENGAMVFDENGETIYSKPFSKEFIKKVCEYVISNKSTSGADFFVGDNYYSPSEVNERMSVYLKARELQIPQVLPLDEILRMDIGKIYLSADKAEFPGFTEGVDYVAKADLPGAWDIIPGGVSKAHGIMKLMEHFNAKPEECAFIGNGENDVEAMDFCDLSFAVGNAPDSVKKHAKWVMEKTCDDGVVAEALKLVYGL